MTASVQNGSVQTTSKAATQGVTITAPSSSSNSLLIWGSFKSSVAASSTTIGVTDDKSNTWTIDAKTDPGGGDSSGVFAASCLAPTAGTQAITLTFTGGTATINVAWMEASGITAVDLSNVHSSAGGSQASPQTLTSSGADTTSYDLVLHALTTSGFTATAGYAAPCATGGGAFTNLAVFQDTTNSGRSNGTADYRINSTAATDDAQDSWTFGNTIIGQILVSYKGTAPPPVGDASLLLVRPKAIAG